MIGGRGGKRLDSLNERPVMPEPKPTLPSEGEDLSLRLSAGLLRCPNKLLNQRPSPTTFLSS
jgi:hypothetical protein